MHAAPADERDVAKYFTRANKERIAELLETLGSMGKARELPDPRYVGVSTHTGSALHFSLGFLAPLKHS